MKILLVGEFSGFHLNLKKGLEKLGHEVTLLSGGDGWKKIQTDKRILSLGIRNPFLKLFYMIKDFIYISNLKDYDIVQFVQPVVFPHYFGYNNFLVERLIQNNKKLFLVAAGSDSMYWKEYKTKFRYSPHDDMKYIDNKGKKHLYEYSHVIKFNEYLAQKVDGIIPIMFDYEIGYKDFKNLKKTIPLPLFLEDIEYKDNIVKDKVVIFHGLNREGFKGTKYIRSALEKLQRNYPQDVEIVIDGHMPYTEYKQLLQKTNIVIDQANSYSYGVNAVISMAMGKIVLSGCEVETLNSFGLETSPIVNILPDENDIYVKLENLIKNKDNFLAMGRESRNYVEKLHDSVLVAKEYESVYCENY